MATTLRMIDMKVLTVSVSWLAEGDTARYALDITIKQEIKFSGMLLLYSFYFGRLCDVFCRQINCAIRKLISAPLQ